MRRIKNNWGGPNFSETPPVIKNKKRHDGTGGVSRFMAPIYSKRKDPGLFFFLCFFRKSVVTVSYAINIHMYKAYHGIYDSLKKDIIFRE